MPASPCCPRASEPEGEPGQGLVADANGRDFWPVAVGSVHGRDSVQPSIYRNRVAAKRSALPSAGTHAGRAGSAPSSRAP